jgi:hypothetical protein
VGSARKRLERKAFLNAKRKLPKPLRDTSKLSSRAKLILKADPKARFVSEKLENERHLIVFAKEVPKHGVILVEYNFVSEQAIAAMQKQVALMKKRYQVAVLPVRRFPRLKKAKKGKQHGI